MSIILALDTSTEACSAALINQGEVFTEYAVCPREHNKRLLAMMDSVLKQASLTIDQVDAIAFGRGPGSFTGVRIATGIVQGVAFGANKPVIGISSLAAMAHGVFRRTEKQQVISAIDARMGEIYLGVYQVLSLGIIQELAPDTVCKPVDSLMELDPAVNWHAIGTGWQTYQDVLTSQIPAQIDNEQAFPEALDIAYLALQAFNNGHYVEASQAQPIYVRDNVTWKKLPGKE